MPKKKFRTVVKYKEGRVFYIILFTIVSTLIAGLWLTKYLGRILATIIFTVYFVEGVWSDRVVK